MKYATEEERLEARRASYRRFAEKKRASFTEADKQARRDVENARYRFNKNDPEKVARMKASNKRSYDKNGYDKKTKALRDKDRNQKPEVKSRRRELQKARYHRIKDDPIFRANAQKRSREHYRENPLPYIAKGGFSNRSKRHQFNKLSIEHQIEIMTFYDTARRLTAETGIPHEVDHIHPLKGVNFCGLHVPWNLQILTMSVNRSKSNKFENADGTDARANDHLSAAPCRC